MKEKGLTGGVIYALILLAACLLYFYYVYQPLNGKLDILAQAHEADVRQLSVYEEYLARQGEVEKDIARLEKELRAERDSGAIPGSEIVFDISRGLKKADIFLNSITMGAEAPLSAEAVSVSGELLYRVPIAMEFICTQEQLEIALQYFETESRGGYYVTSVVIDRAENEKLKVAFGMDAYYYTSQEEAQRSAAFQAERDAEAQKLIEEAKAKAAEKLVEEPTAPAEAP